MYVVSLVAWIIYWVLHLFLVCFLVRYLFSSLVRYIFLLLIISLGKYIDNYVIYMYCELISYFAFLFVS
jgi:hypothetical protein